MDQLLENPLFQSGALPFAVGLFAGVVLRRMGWFWAGCSALAGFYATVYLVVGFDWLPLRSTYKIMWLVLAAGILGLLLDAWPWPRRHITDLLFVLGAAALVWLAWPKLTRMSDMTLWAYGIGAVFYGGWMAASFEGLRSRPLHADSALTALALGTGLTALFSASASYGQLAAALAAALGARWLMQVTGFSLAAGSALVVPVALACALFGFGGLIYAKVPWYCLALFALVPLLARVPLAESMPRWIQGTVVLLTCSIPAALAVYLASEANGSPLF